MENIGQRFRLGIWAVEPEQAREFVEAWRVSADWLTEKLPHERGAVLLEDADDPSRFVSFAPVSDPQAVQEWMAAPEFHALWSQVMELCEAVSPSTLRVVASAGT